MILTLIYKTAEIRSIESVCEVHSRAMVPDTGLFELVISCECVDDPIKVPVAELSRWELRTQHGAQVFTIELDRKPEPDNVLAR